MANVFGFSTEGSGGTFDGVPIVKFDARAGRVFRVDRGQDATGTWTSEPNDITRNFKAVFDLENVEVGWLNFATGGAPDFQLVPIGEKIPDRPSDGHKNGIRFMIKLSKESAGDVAAVREMSSSAKSFLASIEQLYHDYEAGKAKNAGKLPVVVLEDTIPIKSGSGAQTSTNYQPVWKIASWAPRGDLIFKPRAGGGPRPVKPTPPTTGSTRVDPPFATDDESEFG